MEVSVGPNVEISDARGGPSAEARIAADPTDVKRLVASGIVFPLDEEPSARRQFTMGYRSIDGGNSWTPIRYPDPLDVGTGDALVMYDPDGTAYFATIVLGRSENTRVMVYRSRDGGVHWSDPSSIEGVTLDQPKSAVDMGSSKFGGTLYITFAQLHNPHAAAHTLDYHIYVFRSINHGESWEGPFDVANNHEMPDRGLLNNDPVVFSDGELFVPYSEILMSRGMTSFWYSTSRDGGETYSKPARLKLADTSPISAPYCPFYANPVYAVDDSKGPHKDRIYAAWMSRCYMPLSDKYYSDEPQNQGSARLLISSSSDHGRTWSKPLEVSPAPAGHQFGPPTIAVDNIGAVAVSWYDTRESKNGLILVSRYLAASVDGGQRFLPAVAVSSVPTNVGESSYHILGSSVSGDQVMLIPSLEHEEYTGIAADVTGCFHVAWKDGRSGTGQLWTAPVCLARDSGEAERDPVPNLSEIDATSLVDLEAGAIREGPSAGTIEVPFRIRNKSSRVLFPPIHFTVTSVNTWTTFENADNAQTRSGAAYDFSAALRNLSSLSPEGATDEVIFRIILPKEPNLPFFHFRVTARVSSFDRPAPQ